MNKHARTFHTIADAKQYIAKHGEVFGYPPAAIVCSARLIEEAAVIIRQFGATSAQNLVASIEGVRIVRED